MMTQFSFSYKLSGCGWADASVSSGGSALTMTVSYLSDALGDLARAVISLLSEHAVGKVICSWQDEPGEYRWMMLREGDAVRVQIVMFDDCFSRKDCAKGRRLIRWECSLLRLATQVKGQMHQLLNDLGEDGYKERWVNHDFPMQEFMRLSELIQEHKQRLPDNGQQDG